MFPDGKNSEIFFMCDEFSKNFDKVVSKFTITEGYFEKKRKNHRDGKMSHSEVMTILILFRNLDYRCFKHFYLDYVCKHIRHLFPMAVSYSRLVEIQKLEVINLAVFLNTFLMGKCTGISFIGSTPLRVYRN